MQVASVNIGEQVSGEIVYEEFTLNNKRYKLASYYPTIAGEVLHEGFTADKDSLYLILWKDYQCTLKPIARIQDAPIIYNNDGELNIDPLPGQTYTESYWENLEPLTIYNWNDYFNVSYRVGPYTLMEGHGVTTLNASSSNYQLIIKDIPAGWEVWESTQMDTQMREVIKNYSPLLPPTDNKYAAFVEGEFRYFKFKENDFEYINSGLYSPLLLVRTDDFRY